MHRLLFFACFGIVSLNILGQTKGYVNPAAAYCEKMGYTYKITQDKKGNSLGVCILPNDSAVDAWDFYRGKVATEYSYCVKNGYQIRTERKDSAGMITECAVCTKKLKSGKEETIAMPDLMSRNSEPLISNEKKNAGSGIESAVVNKNLLYKGAIPGSFDWRSYNGHSYIGGVRDQGSCGSCYSFGALASAEGVFNFYTGKYDANCIDLSESFLVWCMGSISPYSDHFGGCDGADYDYMELQALCDSGVCYESTFPYVESDPGECSHWDDARVSFQNWYRVACSDTTAIKTAIMTYGVVDAAVNVTQGFQDYTGGVYSDANTACYSSPCYYTPTNHAISLVGWGHDPADGLYWILRNSWGASWGENGYMRIKWNASRVACEVTYLSYSDKPSVTTLPATNVGSTGATLHGNVNPNSKPSNYYFQYGTTTSYGITTASTSIGSGTDWISVSAVVSSLTVGVTYHYRIVATNGVSTSYGEDLTFKTGLPVVATSDITSILTTSALLSGNVLSQGGSSVTARGFCYSTSSDPDLSASVITAGSGTGNFSATLNGLTNSTTYYVRAYATNSYGSSYGNQMIFTTLCDVKDTPFAEDFEGAVFPPECWTSYRGTNGLGESNDWILSSDGNNSSGAAFIDYEYIGGNLAQDWLVTPLVLIPAGQDVVLSFNEKQDYSTNYGSQYSVRISTTSQSDATSFTAISEYDETAFTASYSSRTIDLSAYANQSVYVAFVMEQDDGDSWYLDDIKIGSPAAGWLGTTSNDWSASSNWSGSAIPDNTTDVIIHAGCPNYPLVNETASCNNLSIEDGAGIVITNGANLSIGGNITIGSGVSGSFTINGGACTAASDLYSNIGSTVNIYGGTLNIANWYKNAPGTFSKGNITLSGGTINVADDVLFSNSDIVGIMNGPFVMNIGSDMYINSSTWTTVTNGTINLLGNSGAGPFFFIPSNSAYSSIAYNLNVNAPDRVYITCRSDGTEDVIVNGNLTITAGTLQPFNGAYKPNIIDIGGKLTLGDEVTFSCNGSNDPDIYLGGNFVNNGGTFIPGSNTVFLDGMDQSVSGNNTFYNLTKSVTGAAQLTFGAGSSNVTTVAGTLTLQGAESQLLSLRSTINGTQWEINPQSTRNLSYLDIKDSKNTNSTSIQACDFVNSGNNTNWTFSPLAPTLLLPSNLAANQALSLSLTWNSDPSSDRDSLQVSKFSDFSTFTLRAGNITTKSFQLTGLSLGTKYYWRVRSSNECGNSNWSTVWSFTTTSVSAITDIEGISYDIFPNPVNDIVTIKCSEEIENRIDILTLNGILILEKTGSAKNTTIDLSGLSNGVYFVKISNIKGVAVTKITKE